MHQREAVALVLSTFLVFPSAFGQTFDVTQTFGDGASANFASADVDGDGDSDVLVLETPSVEELPHLVFWINQSEHSGTFIKSGQSITDSSGDSFGFADLDGDGDPDLIASIYGAGFNIWINQNHYSGTFVKSAAEIDYGTFIRPAFGDADGDGDIDILLQGTVLMINQGLNTATFEAFDQDFGPGDAFLAGLRSIQFVDIDNDDDLDFYVGHHGFGSDQLFLNDLDTSGEFIDSGHATTPNPDNFSGTGNIAFGDADGDGDQDLFAQNWQAGLWKNQGVGTGVLLPTDDAPENLPAFSAFALGDFDEDGDIDVYYPDAAGSTVWTNQGVNGGTFVPGPASQPAADIVEAHDVDDDGDLDLIAVRGFTDMVVILNTTDDPANAITVRNDFAALDQNNDEKLSLAESNLPSQEFDAIDSSGDGYLTMSELLAETVGPVGVQTAVWIDFEFTGEESGTLSQPFNSLLEGAYYVASGGTLRLASGESRERIRIGTPMTLIASGGSASIGRPGAQ